MKFIYKIFLLIIVLLICISYVSAATLQTEEGTNIPTTPPEEPPSTAEYFEDRIPEDITNNGFADLSKDPYKSNPSETLKALKKLYPNLEISSINGVKIEGDILTTSDGSKIDLATGKKITLETDGSKVTYFDDGEGTTCLNCEGLTYTSDGFKVGSGEKVDYYGTTSTMVKDYDAKIGTFTVTSADAVIIGSNIFNKVKDSQFSVIANYLRYADVTCNKDNNTALLENNDY